MTNDVINTAEDSTESQTSADNTNNQTFETGAVAEDKQYLNEVESDKTQAAAAQTAAPEARAEVQTPPADTQIGNAASDENSHSTQQEASGDVDFGAILERYEQEQTAYQAGEIVQGKVIDVSDRGVMIDFGYKSEGIVPLEEFTSLSGEVTVKRGDEVEVVIKNVSVGDAPPVLSYSDARNRVSWDKIEKSYNSGEVVTGKIVDKTKGGLKVDLEGIEAFLPGSQIDSRPVGSLDEYIGQDIETKVIRFSRKRNNIVLSRKVITDEVLNEKKLETLNDLQEGYIVEGTVTNLTDYGAFVDIGGIDGLLHVSDMSWGRSQNPGDFFKVGENVQVKVLKLNPESEKISLGYKQLLPDPWATVEELYPIGTRINGKVSSVTDYGAFVELEPGVEGLIHISEMSWSKRIKHPKNLLHKSDDVEVQVLDIHPQDRRISLGIKQLQPNPWDLVGDRYNVGDKVRGKVRNLTDFGAFVEIEEGIEGLVHISDITWSKKVKHPKDALSKGQEVDAVITRLNPENRKISLSIKELTPSAWETFVATHKPGDVVRGKISRFANFGVFVELADELEGLCHISELSEERVNDPEDQFQIGQELDFKILRIEADTQKIGLSHRAVGKEDEPAVDTKIYSTEAKGGMASLAELANLGLNFGKGAEEPAAKTEKSEAETAEAVAESTETPETSEAANYENEMAETTGETEFVEGNSEQTGANPEMNLPEISPEFSEVSIEESNPENAENQTAENQAEESEAVAVEGEVSAQQDSTEVNAHSEGNDSPSEEKAEERSAQS